MALHKIPSHSSASSASLDSPDSSFGNSRAISSYEFDDGKSLQLRKIEAPKALIFSKLEDFISFENISLSAVESLELNEISFVSQKQFKLFCTTILEKMHSLTSLSINRVSILGKEFSGAFGASHLCQMIDCTIPENKEISRLENLTIKNIALNLDNNLVRLPYHNLSNLKELTFIYDFYFDDFCKNILTGIDELKQLNTCLICCSDIILKQLPEKV